MSWLGGHANAAWDWIVQNRQWVFSGIGVMVLGVGWWLLKKVFKRNSTDSAPTSNLPPVNINVSPNISPVFSPTQSNTQTTSAPERKSPTGEPLPDIRAVTYKAEFARGVGDAGKSCFFISFRNEGQAAATDVIAHIGYRSSSGRSMVVDYGCWIEHEWVMNIFRGHTRNLIIAVTDDDRKNFAVNDIGPATNYTQARMVSVGEITPGEWEMVVTLSADKFRRDYHFELTVGQDGSLLCNPEGHEPKAARSEAAES